MQLMPKLTPSSRSVSRKLWLLVAMLMSLTLLLTSCAKMTGIGVPVRFLDTSCEAFRPIEWSEDDTDETIRQAKAHNAAWSKLCPARVPG